MSTIALLAGAFIIAWTAYYTASRYKELPARVPIHFGLSGAADGFGPRPAIWLIVVVQVLLGFIFVGLYARAGDARSLIFGDLNLATCAWLQTLICRAAISGSNRMQPRQFWLGVSLFLAATVASIYV